MENCAQVVNFSAVIFDMDGLVLDTEVTYFMAWKQALAEMGFEFPDNFFTAMSGLQYSAVEQTLLSQCDAGLDIYCFRHLSTHYWLQIVKQQGISVKKGLLNLLKVLQDRNIPFCLATNSFYKNAVDCLKYADIEYAFSIIISRDQVKQGKPAPDVFLLAAKRLATPISDCLVVEDSEIGIIAAKAAGSISVFIPSQITYDQSTVSLADYYYQDLDELAQIIHCC